MADFTVDTKEIDDFFKKLDKAGKTDFKKQIALWFEAMGFELLDIVQGEIIRGKVVDTRLLLNSFTKGDKNNFWKISEGGLTLEIGTRVKYAKPVNDGHWLNPKGVQTRFVPGTWSGDKFTYQKGSKEGMLLRQKFVEGRHYWDKSMVILARVFEKSLERKLQEWLELYF